MGSGSIVRKEGVWCRKRNYGVGNGGMVREKIEYVKGERK